MKHTSTWELSLRKFKEARHHIHKWIINDIWRKFWIYSLMTTKYCSIFGTDLKIITYHLDIKKVILFGDLLQIPWVQEEVIETKIRIYRKVNEAFIFQNFIWLLQKEQKRHEGDEILWKLKIYFSGKHKWKDY